MVSLTVGSATAAVQGLVGLQPVKVPSDELKIPVSPAVRIKAQMSSSIVISGTAHVVFAGASIILTPVLHVEKTTGPQYQIHGRSKDLVAGGGFSGPTRALRTTA